MQPIFRVREDVEDIDRFQPVRDQPLYRFQHTRCGALRQAAQDGLSIDEPHSRVRREARIHGSREILQLGAQLGDKGGAVHRQAHLEAIRGDGARIVEFIPIKSWAATGDDDPA